MTACLLCDGECQGATLRPLLNEDLLWLWQQLAAMADRRGDPALADGIVTIKAPDPREWRAAVLGLIRGRPLLAGQSRRVNLAELTATVRRHGPGLTPGAVAAHASGRRLAERARRRHDRHQFEQRLARLVDACALSSHSPAAAQWEKTLSTLSRTGWIAKLHAAVAIQAGTVSPTMTRVAVGL
jgi:hypothetical protein